MVRTAVVGFVDGSERGATEGVADPEEGASGNDEGDGTDGVNDSMGIQEDDTELSELIRWVVRAIARDAAMAA